MCTGAIGARSSVSCAASKWPALRSRAVERKKIKAASWKKETVWCLRCVKRSFPMTKSENSNIGSREIPINVVREFNLSDETVRQRIADFCGKVNGVSLARFQMLEGHVE